MTNSTFIASTEQLVQKQRLGEYLIKKGFISDAKLRAALDEQRITQDKLGLILVRDGFITKATLLDAILATNPDQIHSEQHYTARVPSELLIELKTMIVAETKDNKVFLATLDNERQVELELQKYYPECKIQFAAADFEKIDDYLEQLRAMLEDDQSLVDKILRQAFSNQVSDIHIIPKYSSYTIQFRRIGVKHNVREGTLDEYNTLTARLKDMSKMDLAERRIPQDGGFSMEYNGKLVDLRVSSVPGVNGETVVIRLLDPDTVQPTLDGLGISRLAEWRKGVSRPDGLCLICGPTGSGKTTTLNATIKERDRFEEAIYTLEDPVEYRIPYVTQVNVNNALGLDFARGIRAFMRADPDVIIVGEIRDPETARNAIKGAETGHLMLGTLHTGSIANAVGRLRDLDVPQSELVYLLRSILVQKLIRLKCQHCNAKGCPACMHTGYGSREIISECVYFSSEKDVRRMLDGEVFWPTMLDDAIEKLHQGLTTEDEILRCFGDDAISRQAVINKLKE